MTPIFVLAYSIPAALSLLPATMDTPAARAMLLAIGLQESKFQHRRQVQGPARGYWQFELVGVLGVAEHRASRSVASSVCEQLGYPQNNIAAIYDAIADNDVLACAFARLLLWTLPDALPRRDDAPVGWSQYRRTWRPGRPHPETWAACWDQAWALVEPLEGNEP